jgi:hypothetical protein
MNCKKCGGPVWNRDEERRNLHRDCEGSIVRDELLNAIRENGTTGRFAELVGLHCNRPDQSRWRAILPDVRRACAHRVDLTEVLDYAENAKLNGTALLADLGRRFSQETKVGRGYVDAPDDRTSKPKVAPECPASVGNGEIALPLR